MHSTDEILTKDWAIQLRHAIRRSSDLATYLDIDPRALAASDLASKDFSCLVTHSYMNRMEKGNARDPLLLQILPRAAETNLELGGLTDPVGDHAAEKAPGVLQKYTGRSLLIATSACAIHCRFCFRRNHPYEIPVDAGAWETSLNTLKNDQSINEVILSGGDPLTLTDHRLFYLLDNIEAFEHVTTIRIHTRIPVVLPARITNQLLERLAKASKNVVVVLHANHANELKHDAADALIKLSHTSRLRLLNQSVLLKGINDNVEVLRDLSQSLFNLGVMPYYLHLLDQTKGAMHFDVAQDVAVNLVRDLRATLPGYLVPRLVREIAGEPAKTIIS